MPEEKCQNPFKRKCDSTDIVLYIVAKKGGETLPICRTCWEKLVKSDKEWGEDH